MIMHDCHSPKSRTKSNRGDRRFARVKRCAAVVSICAVVVGLSACGASVHAPPVTDLTSEASRRQPAFFPGVDMPQSGFGRRGALLAHLGSWVDTPHRLGGTDRSGIDCSAFTAVTYRQVFKRDLPRTTLDQAELGQLVDLESLEPGDLVFFKIESGRHVGVYTGNGEFIHASASRGVMSSALSNPYWSSHYWKSVRVLPQTLELAER